MSAPIGQLPTSETAPDVVEFTRLFQLPDPPTYVSYQRAGYDADFCHISAKHHARQHGGRRIHGWALWQFPTGVMGDFHSIWETPDGDLIDVTPPKFGQSQVLFVRDQVSDIYDGPPGTFVLQTNRFSSAATPFWWNGQSTTEQAIGVPLNNASLIAYCARLGFPPADIITDPTHG